VRPGGLGLGVYENAPSTFLTRLFSPPNVRRDKREIGNEEESERARERESESNTKRTGPEQPP
jgi:hypothetical protein